MCVPALISVGGGYLGKVRQSHNNPYFQFKNSNGKSDSYEISGFILILPIFQCHNSRQVFQVLPGFIVIVSL